MKYKGWKKEPARHSLAARGVGTKRRRSPSKARVMAESPHIPAEMKKAISRDIPFYVEMEHDEVSGMPSYEDRKWLREEVEALVEETLKEDLKPWMGKGWQVQVHRPSMEQSPNELLFTGEIFLISTKGQRVPVPWNYYGYYLNKKDGKWVGSDIGVGIAS